MPGVGGLGLTGISLLCLVFPEVVWKVSFESCKVAVSSCLKCTFLGILERNGIRRNFVEGGRARMV